MSKRVEETCKDSLQVKEICKENKDLVFPDTPDWDKTDWSSFRREAAKDILCAMNCAPGPYMKSLQEAVRDAIEQADELIKQLRDGKK